MRGHHMRAPHEKGCLKKYEYPVHFGKQQRILQIYCAHVLSSANLIICSQAIELLSLQKSQGASNDSMGK